VPANGPLPQTSVRLTTPFQPQLPVIVAHFIRTTATRRKIVLSVKCAGLGRFEVCLQLPFNQEMFHGLHVCIRVFPFL